MAKNSNRNGGRNTQQPPKAAPTTSKEETMENDQTTTTPIVELATDATGGTEGNVAANLAANIGNGDGTAPGTESSGTDDRSQDNSGSDGSVGDANASVVDGDTGNGVSAAAAVSDVASQAAAAPEQPAAVVENNVQPQAPAQEAPVVAAAPVADADDSDAVLGSLSPFAQALLMEVKEYIDIMNPKRPGNAKAGAIAQARLYRTLLSVINGLEEDFNTVFGLVLEAFLVHSEHGRVFNPLNVFRYFDSMNLQEADRTTFRSLLNLLTKTAEPRSRQHVLKQVNMTATLGGSAITEPGRQRVHAFYNL